MALALRHGGRLAFSSSTSRRCFPASGYRGLITLSSARHQSGFPRCRPPTSLLQVGGAPGSRKQQLTTSPDVVDADVIIANGRVIDPSNDVDTECDVAIKDGVVTAVGPGLAASARHQEAVFDAGGCLVTPGLIDIQVHAYQYATPFGIDIDQHCLSRGVTTVVDGGAAGATTFMGLRKFIAEKKKTRLYAFLNIAMHGMSAGDKDVGGEYDSLKLVDPAVSRQCIEEHSDMIVGLKVRLRADACASGKNEDDAFRIALSTCHKTHLPLLTHHAESTIPSEAMTGTMGCPGSLRPGDIYSQMYQGCASGLLDPTSLQLYQSVENARQRGVYFDVGHGQRAFTWTVAERCAELGFYPDLISTNLHIDNVTGPVYDLPTVMSKMLYIGMPLVDVIRAVTHTAARALHRQTTGLGSLSVGAPADVSVLRQTACSVELEDSSGQLRHIERRLEPVAVFLAGAREDIVELETFPNPAILDDLQRSLDRLVIRDATTSG